MEHDQSNPNYKKPDYYSYNPETAQPDSLGVHPSEKKKEAIVPNLLQPESPHKKLSPALNGPNLLQPESLHKKLSPELPHFNPDPNAPKLPKSTKQFTFEKSSEKDTDPTAPKLPGKLREPNKSFTFEKSSEKDTDSTAPKLPGKLRDPKPFTVDTRPKTTTPPNATVADTVPNQTPEQDVRKDDPIVQQQMLNPAIREPQALNTTVKAPDIKSAQEPSMQQATPITEQRSPLTAPSLPLETVQADGNQGSPILWSNNPKPQFSQNQVPLSASVSRVEQPAKPDLEHPQPPIALAPVITLGANVPDIQIAQHTATLDAGAKPSDSGAKAIAGKAFNKFLRQQLRQRSPELAAKVLGASVADGPFPFGEALSVGFTVQTLYEVYQEWAKLQQPKASPSDATPLSQSHQATPAGSPSSFAKQPPIDLGTVPQMGTSTDSVDAFLKHQDAQIQQSDHQLEDKHQREVQLAVSAANRQQQRNAIDTAMGDKLYKVDQQANLDLYQSWLLQNDPKFLDRMNRQAGARYDTLTHQGEDLQFEGNANRQSFRKNLLSDTMYQNDIRAREMIEYSAMELNLNQVTNQGTGFNPKKLAQIRSNFDTVVAGGYAKQLEPKLVKYIETQANAAYLRETGNKEVDRNSPLWKTLRNVELLKYDRTLWDTVQEAPAQTGVMKTMTDQSNNPDLGSNALNRPSQSQPLDRSRLTQPETFPTGTEQKPQQPVGGGFENAANPALTKPIEDFPTNQPVDGVTNVFDYSTWRRNYEKVYGAIPADNQVHHLTTQASFQASALAQQWKSRGLMNVHDAQNLIALPQNKTAYDKSGVKIQHSGSHPEWNRHVNGVLGQAQRRLELRYGSLDKVPDNVMEQTKNQVMQDLREDLLDKDLGIEKGWVKPTENGMDKLSQAQSPGQIG
jgi:A nuclease family of the HNH/ENDO VII superfamily with conserved AHH